MNATDTKIKDNREAILDCEAIIESCDELLAALATHTGKLVDSRFFKKHFTTSNEYRDWTKYSFIGKAYEFDRYNYRISLGTANHRQYLELQTRETTELVNGLTALKNSKLGYIKELNESIEKLTQFSEQDLVNELIALYNKYGKPVVWSKVLDSYEVKYPQN